MDSKRKRESVNEDTLGVKDLSHAILSCIHILKNRLKFKKGIHKRLFYWKQRINSQRYLVDFIKFKMHKRLPLAIRKSQPKLLRNKWKMMKGDLEPGNSTTVGDSKLPMGLEFPCADRLSPWISFFLFKFKTLPGNLLCRGEISISSAVLLTCGRHRHHSFRSHHQLFIKNWIIVTRYAITSAASIPANERKRVAHIRRSLQENEGKKMRNGLQRKKN